MTVVDYYPPVHQAPLFGETQFEGRWYYFVWVIEEQNWIFTWEVA